LAGVHGGDAAGKLRGFPLLYLARFSVMHVRPARDFVANAIAATLLSLVLLGFLRSVLAVEPLPDGTAAGAKNIATFRMPAGMKAELFAAEPKLASPVAIGLDEKGRVYVAEEFRFNAGTEENRTRGFLLEDDLQIDSLEGRLKVFEKHADKFDGKMDWFRRHSDQVRLLEDKDGDGEADVSTVFAAGFNDPLDGLAAGVMARGGKVYFTCIPNLWLLEDKDGDGVADERKSLARGFGVNCAYLGHDLHGLAWGPDGKLYFSVGDRGFNLNTPEGKHFYGPRTGGVFRCEPDGSQLELVHRGLRNPQELAFDQFGNLFADDNNCDKGDDARLVYVVDGGETGWNMAYQTMPEPYMTGPWHAEKMWHVPPATGIDPVQPAYILPSCGRIGTGPSGFLFTSGLSLPERYRNSFMMCNYTGNGGLEAFRVVPRGAAYGIVDYHDFFKPIQATDAEFGYDGKLYVSDFVQLHWDGKSGGGRIYTVFDPERIKEPAVVETAKLFREGFEKRPSDELAKLLAHGDQRVRLAAQFALAERGKASAPLLAVIAAKPVEVKDAGDSSPERLARLHAMWGLGQIGRKDATALAAVVPLLKDRDAEVRGQAAKVLGDEKYVSAAAELLPLVNDPTGRVRFFAAIALGKLGAKEAIEPIFAMLAANNDQDAYLRHAGVIALTTINDREAVQARAKDPSVGVRMGVLLTQRRWEDARVAQFLNDAELRLVTEAARAIHDLPLAAAMPAVAALLPRYIGTTQPEAEPLIRRAISANYRLGGLENARSVARFAAQANQSEKLRLEALGALSAWTEPGPRDRVIGHWRPLEKRDAQIARQAFEEAAPLVLASATGKLSAEAANLVAKLNIKMDDEAFFAWVPDKNRDLASRIAALRLLAARKYPDLQRAVDTALADAEPRMRTEGRDVLADTAPDKALELLRELLSQAAGKNGQGLPGGAALEPQRALATLARLKQPAAGELLDAWAARLAQGAMPAELMLDLVEVLQAAPSESRQQAVKQHDQRMASEPLGKYRVALVGGDAARGRELFVGHAVGQCSRCHKIGDVGGVAGPDLTKVATRVSEKTREHLVESLLKPDAQIAPGFGSLVLELSSGKTLAGVLKQETPKELTLLTPDEKTITVPVSEIEGRTPPKSAMPAMDKALTLRELRDLVEYLSTLK